MTAHDVVITDTVDEIVARVPGSFEILNTFGIDTCGGGRAMLADAATHARVDTKAVLEAYGMRAEDKELLLLAMIAPRPGSR